MSKVLGGPDARHTLHSNHYFQEREKAVPPMADMTFPLTEKTIAEHMQEAGYRSLLVGKWVRLKYRCSVMMYECYILISTRAQHLGHSPGHRPEQRGFDEMVGFNLGASLYMPTSHPDTVGVRLDDFADRFLWGNLRYFVCESNATDSSNFEPNEYMTGTSCQ